MNSGFEGGGGLSVDSCSKCAESPILSGNIACTGEKRERIFGRL